MRLRQVLLVGTFTLLSGCRALAPAPTSIASPTGDYSKIVATCIARACRSLPDRFDEVAVAIPARKWRDICPQLADDLKSLLGARASVNGIPTPQGKRQVRPKVDVLNAKLSNGRREAEVNVCLSDGVRFSYLHMYARMVPAGVQIRSLNGFFASY